MTNKTAEAVTQQLFVCSPVTVCAPRSFSSNSLTRSNNSTSSSVHFQNSLLFLDVLLLRHFRAPESKAADEPHACAVRDVSVRMNSCSTENNSVDVATVRLCSSTHAGSSPAFVQRRGLPPPPSPPLPSPSSPVRPPDVSAVMCRNSCQHSA